MKTIKTILLSAVAMMTVSSLTSCSEDDFGKTIFSSEETGLDKTSYSYPLDAYLQDNLQAYHTQIKVGASSADDEVLVECM